MGYSIRQLVLTGLVATSSFLAGCYNAKDEAQLLFVHGRYERWLRNKRPYLASLPASIVFYQETSLEYDLAPSPAGRPPQPVIEYLIKAADWDGVIDLQFHVSVDAQNHPIRLREESGHFYKLPASATVVEGGHRMHRYYGVDLPPGQIGEIVRRAVRGDHFDDLRSQATGDIFSCTQREEGDDGWEKLRRR